MKILQITAISDPSHGWIRVNREEIEDLGIQNDISCFSYQDPYSDDVFLEEDSDAAKYITAIRDLHPNVTFIWDEQEVSYANSPRTLNSYTA